MPPPPGCKLRVTIVAAQLWGLVKTPSRCNSKQHNNIIQKIEYRSFIAKMQKINYFLLYWNTELKALLHNFQLPRSPVVTRRPAVRGSDGGGNLCEIWRGVCLDWKYFPIFYLRLSSPQDKWVWYDFVKCCSVTPLYSTLLMVPSLYKIKHQFGPCVIFVSLPTHEHTTQHSFVWVMRF